MQEVCRLCLHVTLEDNFQNLDDVKFRMLKILPLNLGATVSNPKICCTCVQNLQLLFDFKMSCLNNNDFLKTYVTRDVTVKLNLDEIIKKKVGIGIKGEEESVCRFCLDHFENNLFLKLNIDQDIFLRDMLEKCVPEIDLNITNNPLICNNCMELLQNQFNFMLTCMDNEEKITYFQTNKQELSLYDIVKQLNLKEPLENRNLTETAKVEEFTYNFNEDCIKIEEGHVSINNIKIEDESEVKQESNEITDKFNLPENPENGKLPNNTNQLKSYPCTMCSYQTIRRADLRKHYITHQNPQEVKYYKCTKCDFQTKWIGDLSVHNYKHMNPSDIPMYKCPYCLYQSKYNKHLQRHINQMHMDKKRYKCSYCTYLASERWMLRSHQKKRHNIDVELELKPDFSCRRCEYSTASKEDLVGHMKAHRLKDKIDKQYKCNHCKYESDKLCHLREHSKRHRTLDEVEEIFICYECGFRTKYKKSIITHFGKHRRNKTLKRKQ